MLDDEPIDNFNLPLRIENILRENDIFTVKEAKEITRKEFLSWKGAGISSWNTLQRILAWLDSSTLDSSTRYKKSRKYTW